LTAAGEYWSLDIPGLTENQAVSLHERLASEFDDGVIVASPRHWMVRMFDRSSVAILASCLRAALAAGGMSNRDAAGMHGLLEDFEAWLDQADE
jgi:hypothetical protein